jgi:hypothetical protein
MFKRFRRSRPGTSLAVVTVAAGLIWYATSSASANDGVPEGSAPMNFINSSFPQWNFAQAHGNNACFPVEAISGFNPGQEPAAWPNADPVTDTNNIGKRITAQSE